MYLTKNMRVNANGDPKLVAWSEWLQSVGDGLEGEEVKVPEEICTTIEEGTKKKPMAEKDSLKGLIAKVFPNLQGNLADLEWLTGRSILTPTNNQRHHINDTMVQMAPGKEVRLRSADVVDNVQDAVSFSVEYCNSLEPTGLPKHEITLKPGVPVMLICMCIICSKFMCVVCRSKYSLCNCYCNLPASLLCCSRGGPLTSGASGRTTA